MKYVNNKIFALLLLAGCTTGASATIIDFDHPDAHGFNGDVNPTQMPLLTQGFELSSNMSVIDVTHGQYSASGPAHSGNFAVLNNFDGDTTSLTAAGGAEFSLKDFWIRSWFASTATTSVTGYLKGIEIDSISFFRTNSWQDIVTNFAQVDQVLIRTTGSFLLDDIRAESSAVPEPAGLALLGLGLAALAGARRRKNRVWQK